MSKQEAIERLRKTLPAIKIAVEMAKLQVPGGTSGLAIIAKAPDGSGRITATFEAEAFLRDLEEIVFDGDPLAKLLGLAAGEEG